MYDNGHGTDIIGNVKVLFTKQLRQLGSSENRVIYTCNVGEKEKRKMLLSVHMHMNCSEGRLVCSE